MSIHTENFRRAAIAAATAWIHAADAIGNARLAGRAHWARQAAEAAALESLDATKFADAAYAREDNDSARDVAASAHVAYTIALRAADAAENSA